MVDRLAILCCPQCKGEIKTAQSTITPSGRLKSAVLVCPVCDDVVGVVCNFKYDFVHFDKQACIEQLRHRNGLSAVLPYEVTDEILHFDDPRLELRGAWEAWDGRYQLSNGRSGDELAFSGEFLDVSVRLLKHPWSGFVRCIVDESTVLETNLYQPKWSTVVWFPVANDLSPGYHALKIVPTGRKVAESAGSQVLFHELVITRASEQPIHSTQAIELNRVLPVFPTVIELMKNVPQDGLILDCGSGDRVLGDSRCISMDYQQYQLPAVYGDTLKLPFKSNTFDLVFSQALLEHVTNPFLAVEEMRRVSKPGGIVWAGMAFLQPVHAVPSHYFNATTWGLEELFRKFEVLEVSWFGELSFTMDWLLKEAGVAEKMKPEEYQTLIERIRSLDSLVSYDALRTVASGVAIRARKPL